MTIKKIIVITILSFLLVIPALSQTAYPPTNSDTVTMSKADLRNILNAEISKAVDAAVAVAVKDTSIKYEKQATEDKITIETQDKESKEKDAKIKELQPMLYNAQADFKNLQATQLQTNVIVGAVCVVGGIILGILAHNVIH